MKRIASVFLCLCMILSLCGVASAKQETSAIEITYRGISIVLDGSEIIPTDANGTPVEPFIYNGTTYLPVRGVASALSLSVDWDSATNTVTLTNGGAPVTPTGAASKTNGTAAKSATYRDIAIVINGVLVTPKDAAGNTVEPFIIDGTTYLPVRAISEALGLSVQWDGDTNTVTLSSSAPQPGNDSEPTPVTPITPPEDTSAGVVIHGRPASTTVYVSRSGKIHSVSDCSGMKNYTEMTLGEADGKGYDYCSNCW